VRAGRLVEAQHGSVQECDDEPSLGARELNPRIARLRRGNIRALPMFST